VVRIFAANQRRSLLTSLAGSAVSKAVAMKTSDAIAHGMVVRLAVESNDRCGADFRHKDL